MNTIMTEEQMRERIKEIDKERNKLRDEKEKYEKYFSEKKKQDELELHKSYIGKYFVSLGLEDNEYDYIKAFKVLSIGDYRSDAVCEALINGERDCIEKAYGIEILTLRLWSNNRLEWRYNPSAAKVIDFYREISEEEFEELFNEYFEKLKGKLNE